MQKFAILGLDHCSGYQSYRGTFRIIFVHHFVDHFGHVDKEQIDLEVEDHVVVVEEEIEVEEVVVQMVEIDPQKEVQER